MIRYIAIRDIIEWKTDYILSTIQKYDTNKNIFLVSEGYTLHGMKYLQLIRFYESSQGDHLYLLEYVFYS